jgi:hypothetical protein
MYHIVDAILNKDSDSYKIAIFNVFEEFGGSAVSSLIASLTCTFQLFSLLLSNIGRVSKSNSKGIYC